MLPVVVLQTVRNFRNNGTILLSSPGLECDEVHCSSVEPANVDGCLTSTNHCRAFILTNTRTEILRWMYVNRFSLRFRALARPSSPNLLSNCVSEDWCLWTVCLHFQLFTTEHGSYKPTNCPLSKSVFGPLISAQDVNVEGGVSNLRWDVA